MGGGLGWGTVAFTLTISTRSTVRRGGGRMRSESDEVAKVSLLELINILIHRFDLLGTLRSSLVSLHRSPSVPSTTNLSIDEPS